ncbi:hypothetical protein AB0N09_34555 [Streptomyces erythrochromogenes]|uniref:hypothetical protein n=1 Tax=Streptomyces erythrochromogenes TaxID=285574 RepID=UPI0034203482
MGYVLLGHGGMDVRADELPPDMGIIAIPQGTTIQFFSDAGQGLLYGSPDLDMWEQFVPHLTPLDSTCVTYNLTLGSAWDLWDRELRNDPTFGGHELIRPGIGDIPDPIRLCTGTPGTCPTRPAQVAEGFTHTCDGILGLLQGADLFWVACTTLDHADETVLVAARQGTPRCVLLGADPDRTPDLAAPAREAVRQINALNVERADPFEPYTYVVAGDVLFIGPGHTREGRAYIGAHDDFHAELCAVTGWDDGTVTIQFVGVPPEWYRLIRSAVAECAPDAEVEFLDREVKFRR